MQEKLEVLGREARAEQKTAQKTVQDLQTQLQRHEQVSSSADALLRTESEAKEKEMKGLKESLRAARSRIQDRASAVEDDRQAAKNAALCRADELQEQLDSTNSELQTMQRKEASCQDRMT